MELNNAAMDMLMGTTSLAVPAAYDDTLHVHGYSSSTWTDSSSQKI